MAVFYCFLQVRRGGVYVCGAWCQSLASLQTDGYDGRGQIMDKEEGKKEKKKKRKG